MGKIMEIPGGRGSNAKPSGTENPIGQGGVKLDIFWNHTLQQMLCVDNHNDYYNNQ